MYVRTVVADQPHGGGVVRRTTGARIDMLGPLGLHGTKVGGVDGGGENGSGGPWLAGRLAPATDIIRLLGTERSSMTGLGTRSA